jgi:hypothetical protein
VVGVGDYIAVDGRSMVILADKEKKSIDASSIYSPLSRKLTGLWTIGSCPLTHVYRHAYIVAHLHLNFVDLLLEFDHKLQYHHHPPKPSDKMDPPQTHNQSIVAKWQVGNTVAKKRKPNGRIPLNTPTPDSPRALSPSAEQSQPQAGPSTPPVNVPENQTVAPAPRKKSRINPVNVEQLAAKYAPPTRKLNELGGLDEQIDQLLEVVGLPLRRPEMYHQMGTERPKGVLLHGVQGGGKTQLVNCLAGVSILAHPVLGAYTNLQTFQLPFIKVSAPSIVSGMSGESEKTLRDTFDEAKVSRPCHQRKSTDC